MTNFEAVHPRNQAGIPGAGQFKKTEHTGSGVTIQRQPALSPREQYLQVQENAQILSHQVQVADRHRDDLALDQGSAALKGIALGIKDAFPDARYLSVEEDNNRYWATGLTDEDGNEIASGSDEELRSLELFGEDELETELHSLSCTDTRWMDGVTPDDGLAAGLGRNDVGVLIDLDKAAGQELEPPRSRLDAEVVSAEARETIARGINDALHYLGILEERAEETTKEALESVRERIAGLQQLVQR